MSNAKFAKAKTARYCDCGGVAVAFRRGGFGCARCIAIEDSLYAGEAKLFKKNLNRAGGADDTQAQNATADDADERG